MTRRWCVYALVWGTLCAARAAEVPEPELKAAYLFHFTQFVNWPEADFASPAAPFVIGIFGADDLEAALATMVRGERVGSHRLEVRHLSRPVEAGACQMVFVPNGLEGEFRLARTGAVPVLTVGESDGFLRSGGMIEFYSDRTHVRLRINLQAARDASLTISSKLLRVAQVVSPSSLNP
jgi:hypothetical protein